MQLIVLGMHRSGTSLAGQLMESFGFHFGPETHAIAPKADNPQGYWERKDVIDLNDQAFAALGVTWERVGSWGPGALPEAFLQKFDIRAREIIAEYPPGKPWFVKDPRMCVTLPLWKKHLDDPVYLLVYRDPLEIARSLWSRNQYPPKLVMALWERYVGDALNATQGERRILLRYSDLLADPERAVFDFAARLRALGVEPPCTPESALGKLHVNHSLRHHRRNLRQVEIPFTESQKNLDRRFRDGTALEEAQWVDVSEANRWIGFCQDIVETGGSAQGGFSDSPQALPASTEDRLLNIGQSLCAKRSKEAFEALEAIHLLKRHGKRAYPEAADVASFYAIGTLAHQCDRLASWNPLSSRYRRARRFLVDYTAAPPVTLTQFIKKSGSEPGKQWVQKLAAATEAVEPLLGDFVLGRFPLLPEQPAENESGRDATAGLKQYHEALQECARRVRAALEPVQALALFLQSRKGDGTAEPCEAQAQSSSGKPAQAQADFERLLQWSAELCLWNPWSGLRNEALREYKAFRQGLTGSLEAEEAKRFQSRAQVVEAASLRLQRLLQDLEQAMEETGRMGGEAGSAEGSRYLQSL